MFDDRVVSFDLIESGSTRTRRRRLEHDTLTRKAADREVNVVHCRIRRCSVDRTVNIVGEPQPASREISADVINLLVLHVGEIQTPYANIRAVDILEFTETASLL